MFTFNFYSLPLDSKKSDRVIDVAPLLTKFAASKLTRTSQDGVSYTMHDGTSISLAYKGEATSKRNYLEIDCSALPAEQKLLGIDKSYWFMVNTKSVNSPSNFTSLWSLDVFATYGQQVFNDLNGKDIRVLRRHADRYIKKTVITPDPDDSRHPEAIRYESIGESSERTILQQNYTTSHPQFNMNRTVYPISGSFTDNHSVGDTLYLTFQNKSGVDKGSIKGTEWNGMKHNFALYYSPYANTYMSWYLALDTELPNTIVNKLDDIFTGRDTELYQLEIKYLSWNSAGYGTPAAPLFHSYVFELISITKLVANKPDIITEEIWANYEFNNTTMWNQEEVIANPQVKKILALANSMEYLSATDPSPAEVNLARYPDRYGMNKYAIIDTTTKWAQRVKADMVSGIQDIHIGGVLAPFHNYHENSFPGTYLDRNSSMIILGNTTRQIRESAFIYPAFKDLTGVAKLQYGKKVVENDQEELSSYSSRICGITGNRYAQFGSGYIGVTTSLPVGRVLNFNSNHNMDKFEIYDVKDGFFNAHIASNLWDDEAAPHYNRWKLNYEAFVNNTTIPTYARTKLNSINQLTTFDPKNEPKLFIDQVKLSFNYSNEGIDYPVEIRDLIIDSHQKIYMTQYEMFSPTASISNHVWSKDPLASVTRINNRPEIRGEHTNIVISDTSIAPLENESYRSYAYENSNRIEAAKAQIQLQADQALRNGVMSTISGGLQIVGGAAAMATGVGAVAGASMMASGGMSLAGGINSIASARENADMARKQLQSELNDAGRQANKFQGGSVSTFLPSTSMLEKYPYTLTTLLPNEKHLESIAKYLHKFGYRTDLEETFSENIWKSRNNFNYIQIQDISTIQQTGNYHKEIVDLIQFELANGVRIWHTPDIGDYSKGNIERNLL